jgi:hypothetical protein
MRALVLVLCLAGLWLAFPRPLAAGCEEDLRGCLRKTILLSSPEDFDLLGCQADYVLCIARMLRFA